MLNGESEDLVPVKSQLRHMRHIVEVCCAAFLTNIEWCLEILEVSWGFPGFWKDFSHDENEKHTFIWVSNYEFGVFFYGLFPSTPTQCTRTWV